MSVMDNKIPFSNPVFVLFNTHIVQGGRQIGKTDSPVYSEHQSDSLLRSDITALLYSGTGERGGRGGIDHMMSLSLSDLIGAQGQQGRIGQHCLCLPSNSA